MTDDERDAEIRAEARAWGERDAREEGRSRARVRRVSRVLLILSTAVPWALTAAIAYVIAFEPGAFDEQQPGERGGTVGASVTNLLLEWLGAHATGSVVLLVSVLFSSAVTLLVVREQRKA
jgi:hypothetical protein